MNFEFYKYQGTGNDFVVIDNRSLYFPKNDTNLISKLCDRNFGIGADGLILLENHSSADFTMVYFNADGKESTMCGNGGRCIVHFAKHLSIIETKTTFEAIDGLHKATIKDNQVAIEMKEVNAIDIQEDFTFLDTGSPHHVALVDNVKNFDVVTHGKAIRYEQYGEEGANVNFVTQTANNKFEVRTYERGVENETLSCGTGVTAVAIAMHTQGHTQASAITLDTPGGILQVSFLKSENGYRNIVLTGPATQVFKGTWL